MKLIHSAPFVVKPGKKDTKSQLIEILQQIHLEKYLFRQHAFFKEPNMNDEESLHNYFYQDPVDEKELAKLKGAFNIWGDLCKADRISVIAEFSRIAEIKSSTLSRTQRSLIFCQVFIDNFLVVLSRG